MLVSAASSSHSVPYAALRRRPSQVLCYDTGSESGRQV